MEIESLSQRWERYQILIILRFKRERNKKQRRERELEMGEMKYQRRRASCAATATCVTYGISNQISPISFGGQGKVRLCLLLVVAAWHHCPEQRRHDS